MTRKKKQKKKNVKRKKKRKIQKQRFFTLWRLCLSYIPILLFLCIPAGWNSTSFPFSVSHLLTGTTKRFSKSPYKLYRKWRIFFNNVLQLEHLKRLGHVFLLLFAFRTIKTSLEQIFYFRRSVYSINITSITYLPINNIMLPYL